jgi:hypothetical protein
MVLALLPMRRTSRPAGGCRRTCEGGLCADTFVGVALGPLVEGLAGDALVAEVLATLPVT